MAYYDANVGGFMAPAAPESSALGYQLLSKAVGDAESIAKQGRDKRLTQEYLQQLKGVKTGQDLLGSLASMPDTKSARFGYETTAMNLDNQLKREDAKDLLEQKLEQRSIDQSIAESEFVRNQELEREKLKQQLGIAQADAAALKLGTIKYAKEQREPNLLETLNLKSQQESASDYLPLFDKKFTEEQLQDFKQLDAEYTKNLNDQQKLYWEGLDAETRFNTLNQYKKETGRGAYEPDWLGAILPFGNKGFQINENITDDEARRRLMRKFASEESGKTKQQEMDLTGLSKYGF